MITAGQKTIHFIKDCLPSYQINEPNEEKNVYVKKKPIAIEESVEIRCDAHATQKATEAIVYKQQCWCAKKETNDNASTVIQVDCFWFVSFVFASGMNDRTNTVAYARSFPRRESSHMLKICCELLWVHVLFSLFSSVLWLLVRSHAVFFSLLICLSLFLYFSFLFFGLFSWKRSFMLRKSSAHAKALFQTFFASQFVVVSCSFSSQRLSVYRTPPENDLSRYSVRARFLASAIHLLYNRYTEGENHVRIALAISPSKMRCRVTFTFFLVRKSIGSLAQVIIDIFIIFMDVSTRARVHNS